MNRVTEDKQYLEICLFRWLVRVIYKKLRHEHSIFVLLVQEGFFLLSGFRHVPALSFLP